MYRWREAKKGVVSEFTPGDGGKFGQPSKFL